MLFAVLENPPALVREDKEPNNCCQYGTKEVYNDVVAERASQNPKLHEGAQEGHGDKVLSLLETTDTLLGNFVGFLLGVVTFKKVGDSRLGDVLNHVAGREKVSWVDNVNLDILGVQQKLLRDCISHTTQGKLGRAVRSVASNSVECGDTGGHDEMPRLVDRCLGGEPLAENGMRQLSGSVEVDVHVPAQRLHGHIDKELWTRHAGDAPDNIGRLAMVPANGLGQDRTCV